MNLVDLFLPGSPYWRILSAKLGGDRLTIQQSFSNWHVDGAARSDRPRRHGRAVPGGTVSPR
jgi:hypothetical protein